MKAEKRRQVILTLLGALVFVFAALNGSRYFTRLDLTETKAYTISEVSKRLFERIDEQVRITYYVSSRLTDQFPQTQEIADLLAEYAASSRGSIEVELIDPTAQEITSRVESLGVAPRQLEVAEAGEQTIALVYSGIVIEYLDRFEALPFVFGVSTLEYEVTSTIRDLLADRNPSLGLIAAADADGRPRAENLSYAASALGEVFDVREIAAGEPIADDVDVLLVVGAQSLSHDALIHIDQYIMRGGSGLLAIDAATVSLQAGLQAIPAGREAAELLGHYGIEVGEALLLDRSSNQIVVQEPSARMIVQRAYPYPHWIRALERYTSEAHPITSRFTGLDLYWPTYLQVPELEDLQAERIVATTPDAWLMSDPYATNPSQSAIFAVGAEATIGQYSLVVAATGELDSYYDQVDAEATGVAEFTSDTTEGRLVVVGDADFLDDRLLQATGSGGNLDFLLNAAQWLANDEELLQIRTRTARNLRLDAIADEAQRRSRMVFGQAVNIYIVPLAVIGAGLIRFFRRRRRSIGGPR